MIGGRVSWPNICRAIFQETLTFIVQNMPGGGSLIAANYLFLQAKPDGLTLGMPNNSIYIDQLVGRSEASYQNRKISLDWLARKTQYGP